MKKGYVWRFLKTSHYLSGIVDIAGIQTQLGNAGSIGASNKPGKIRNKKLNRNRRRTCTSHPDHLPGIIDSGYGSGIPQSFHFDPFFRVQVDEVRGIENLPEGRGKEADTPGQ